jgi:hypothetical protein
MNLRSTLAGLVLEPGMLVYRENDRGKFGFLILEKHTLCDSRPYALCWDLAHNRIREVFFDIDNTGSWRYSFIGPA